ncbi:MAG: type sorting protein [Cyanobacteria bacterium RYN_339]|nr:type sorting protein [Cyanobacteria bacterium RYN_339]
MRFSVACSVALALACGIASCSGPAAAPTKSSAKAGDSGPSGAAQLTSPAATTLLTGAVTVPAAIVAQGGGNIVAQGGGNIVAQGGGNIVAQGGGNFIDPNGNITGGSLISPNGGTYALMATRKDVPLANTQVALLLPNGQLLKRNGKPLVVRTGAGGVYRFQNLPVGVTFQVIVLAATEGGKPARLKALARASAEGAVADVSPASTLVTGRAVKNKSKLGDLDLASLGAAILATKKALETDPLVDLTDDAKVGERMAQVEKANPDLGRTLDSVSAKLDQNAIESTALSEQVAQTKEPEPEPEEQPSTGASSAPPGSFATSNPFCAAGTAPTLLLDEAKKPVEFVAASGLALDADAKLVVADRFGTVQRFPFLGGAAEPVTTEAGATVLATFKAALFVAAPRSSSVMRYLNGKTASLLTGGQPFTPEVMGGAVDPAALAAGSEGQLYLADANKGRAFKVEIGADGTGTPTRLAAAETFRSPGGLAVDAAGNVFVADTFNHCIKQISPDGKVAVFAGAAGQPGEPKAATEPAATARFIQPAGLALGPDGSLYVADLGNQAIRVIKGGTVTTLAAVQCGAGTPERLSALGGLALTGDGKTLFVANGSHVLRFTFGESTPTPSPTATPVADAGSTATAAASGAATPKP